MRLAHLLLVALAIGSGVVAFAAWRGAGTTAHAELLERGAGLVPIVVTALEESRARAGESIEREQQRLLSVARRARLELTLPLGPAAERLGALAREEQVGRLYLFDAAGQVVVDVQPSRGWLLGNRVPEEQGLPTGAEAAALADLLPADRAEATRGVTLNAFASAHRILAAVRTRDGGAVLVAAAADHLEEAQRGLGAQGVLQGIARLPDVRGVALRQGASLVAEAGSPPLAGDLQFRERIEGASNAPFEVELSLSTRRVDSLVVTERARILLWGGLASGIALLAAFLLWRRERTLAQQRARDEAAQREQQRLAEMGVLTGLFVHEVSNPLNALGLQLEGVKRAVGATGAEEIARVKGTLGRVRSALESFLQVATPMEGRAGEVYAAERLRRTVADLRAESPTADLALEVLPEAEARTVAARVPVLDQALRNLLRNALQAAPAGSQVVARWEAGEQAGVSFVVRDAGPGFSAQVLESGGALGVSGRREGHGLGLYLARRIVEGLGGRMTLANPEGGGAEVRVWLPTASADAGSHA